MAGAVTPLDGAAQRVDAAFVDDPRAAALVHRALGRGYRSLGALVPAERHLAAVLDLLEADDESLPLERYAALWELVHLYDESDMQKGLFLAPVDYPSVPLDSLRYRVAITAAHSREDLDQALQILEDVVLRRTRLSV